MNIVVFRRSFTCRLSSFVTLLIFCLTSVVPPAAAKTTSQSVLDLPVPGTLVESTDNYQPPIITGITIHPDDPLQMSFLVDQGETPLTEEAFRANSNRMIKYFLAALTVPEDELWVNLSPYEENRIVGDHLGLTEMGRDLLAQDYLLKQLTSSMMYPEGTTGQEFWSRVHTLAYERFGTTDVPMNTFNKIWIVPQKAVIYEHDNRAVIVESKLKVMLEEDYLALENHQAKAKHGQSAEEADVVTGAAAEVVREVLIPEIEKEVNSGKTFSQLRQVYHAVILADWYKENLRESLLGKTYVGQNKTVGIESEDKDVNQRIYEQYVESFKKGVYNYIKEDINPVTGDSIPRHYFSGGADFTDNAVIVEEGITDAQSRALAAQNVRLVDVALNFARPDQAMIADELAAKRGTIDLGQVDPSADLFFNVQRWISKAAENGGVGTIDRTALLRSLIRKTKVTAQLSAMDVDADALFEFVEDVTIVAVDDIKNGSPAIVIRNASEYRVAKSVLRENAIYIGAGLVDQLEAKDKQSEVGYILLRELVGLYQAKKINELAESDREAAREEAEAAMAKMDTELHGQRIDKLVQKTIDTFIDGYYEQLLQKNVVWDYESSVMDEVRGKELVGGKTYQQGLYWSEDPEGNLRSFGGTTTASNKFLKSYDDLIPRINKILADLDVADDQARVQAEEDIRALIVSYETPADIAADVAAAYTEQVRITGQELVAVRSSGKAEDASIVFKVLKGVTVGSNAGQHDSYLGEAGEADVVRRWRDDVSSLFTEQVLKYRDTLMVITAMDEVLSRAKRSDEIVAKLRDSDNRDDRLVSEALQDKNFNIITSVKLRDALRRNGFVDMVDLVEEKRSFYMDVENIAMGVTIMPMADVVTSFVIMGHDISSNWTGFTFQNVPESEYLNVGRVATLTFTWRLGESIVQGVTTPDTILVHVIPREDGTNQVNILNRQLGTKTVQAIYTHEAFKALGISEAQVEPFLQLLEGETVEADLHGVKSGVATDKLIAALQKAVAAKVDVTADLIRQQPEEEDEEEVAIVDLFDIDADRVKLLVHLIKAKQEDREIKSMFTDVPKVLRERFSVTDSQIVDVANEFMKKAAGYGHLVDMEGGIGHNLGRANTPITVQRRGSNVEADVKEPDTIRISYTYVREKDLKEARKDSTPVVNSEGLETELTNGQLLAQGIPTRNSFTGTIYKIDDERELPEQFEEIKALAANGKEIIIRTRETTPDYNAVLQTKNVRGVIADVGGATSHAAVMSRELGIATVVGIQTWMNKLEGEIGTEAAQQIFDYINTTGNVVTVDANANERTGFGMVYAGVLPISLRKLEIKLDRLPEIFTKIGYIMGMPHPMLQMSKIARYNGYSGVALMRGEFAYAEENINPRFGRAFDNLMVYNLLRLGDESGDRQSVTKSVEERAATERFEGLISVRDKLRTEGVEIALDRTEALLLEYRESGAEAFLQSLSKYARRDLNLIRDHHDEILAADRQMLGYLSYNEFFEAVHGGAISTMAAANNVDVNAVLYRSIDFKKNEAAELIGSRVFDPEPEVSTMIGERGARWLLQPENEVILREEIQMLLRQVAKGYSNIGFFFPFVSTPNELDRLTEILNEEEQAMSEELGRPIFLREVGQMTELPSNVIQADEFIAVLKKHEGVQEAWFTDKFGADVQFKRKSFLSFGTNDLTQLTLGADRDNPMMTYLFNEAHPFVTESIRHVAAAAVDATTKCGLCGQALVNLVNVNPEAAEAILMILGQTGGYAGTDYLGTVAAITRAASATLKHGVVQSSDEGDVLVSGFESQLTKGAANRPAFVVESAAELDDTYIGDFVALANGIDVEVDVQTKGEDKIYTIVDEGLREKFARLGTVIVPQVKGFASRADFIGALEQMGVPVIKTSVRTVRDLQTAIQSGQRVTIDFNQQMIFQAEQEVYVNVPELVSSLNISEEEVETESVEFDASFRVSQFYKDEGVHPLANLIGSDASAKQETLRSNLKQAILAALANSKSTSLVYQTLDLDTDDLVRLADYEQFLEEAEVNPALGFAGLDALVKDDQWKSLLSLEMEVVAELIAEGHDISVQFNSVKVPESVEQGIAVAVAAGVPESTRFGINTAWPGNYLALDQYIANGLSFVTLNERKLAQGYLSADLYKNSSVIRFYTEKKVLPNLKRPMAMITKSVADAGIALNRIGFSSDSAMLASGQRAPEPETVIYALMASLAEQNGGATVSLPAPLGATYSFDLEALEEAREILTQAGAVLFNSAFQSGRKWRRSMGIPYKVLVGLPQYDLDEENVLFILAAGHALGLWVLSPDVSERQFSRDQIRDMYRLDGGATYPVVRFIPGSELAGTFMEDAAMAAEVDSYMAVRIKSLAKTAVDSIQGNDRAAVTAKVKSLLQPALARYSKDGEEAMMAIVNPINDYFLQNYGIKPFRSDTDEFGFSDSTISWLSVPIGKKRSVVGWRAQDVADQLVEQLVIRLDYSYGLTSGKVLPDAVRDVTELATNFVQNNLNPAKRMAFTRELALAFQEEADLSQGDFDAFASGIIKRINSLRPGMLVAEPKIVPRLYGDRVVTWLNRIIAVKTDQGFEVVGDEFNFFVDALTAFVNIRYTDADEKLSTETILIHQLLDDASFKELPGDNEKVVKLSMAGAHSNGQAPGQSNPEVLIGWAEMTAAIAAAEISVSEKLAFLEDLYIEVLQREPRVDPIQLTHRIVSDPDIPKDSRSQIYDRLVAYLGLIRSGAVNGTDDVNQVLVAVNQVVADQALTADASKEVGGIDLDPNLFDLQRVGDGSLVFPVYTGTVEQLNLNGFVPVIINVTPVPNLPLLLGMYGQAEEESNSISYDSLNPMDLEVKSKTDTTDQLSWLNN